MKFLGHQWMTSTSPHNLMSPYPNLEYNAYAEQQNGHARFAFQGYKGKCLRRYPVTIIYYHKQVETGNLGQILGAIARTVPRSVPSANVPCLNLVVSMTVSPRCLPLLQLVMIDSSVNSNQHSGSTSTTLDCSQLAAVLDVHYQTPRSEPYHNGRQHGCSRSRFNGMLHCVVLIALIRWTRIRPQSARGSSLRLCSLKRVGKT